MGNYSEISVFVEVVNKGSFTGAAEALELSRPVVSKALNRLEERLGVRLLHRTTRRLSLTEAGEHFYTRCRQGLNTLQEAEDEILHLQSQPRGILRVNAPMSFGILHIAPLLADFNAAYPEVLLQLQLEDRTLDVIEAGFDVSVRIAPIPDSSLVARRLCPCRHVIVASPGYLGRMGTPETPGALLKHQIVAYRYQVSGDEWIFQRRNEEQKKVSLTVDATINNSLAIREAVLGGLGIARMPTFIVGDDLQQGRLVRLLPDYDTLQLDVHLVYPQRRFLSPKVSVFMDFLAERITDTPTWDARL